MIAGVIAERIRVAEELQGIGAAYAAMPVGAIAVALFWIFWPQQSGGLGAVGVGLGIASLAWLVGLGLIAAAVHVAIGRVGASFPALVRHRPLVLGGLYGALPIASVFASAQF